MVKWRNGKIFCHPPTRLLHLPPMAGDSNPPPPSLQPASLHVLMSFSVADLARLVAVRAFGNGNRDWGLGDWDWGLGTGDSGGDILPDGTSGNLARRPPGPNPRAPHRRETIVSWWQREIELPPFPMGFHLVSREIVAALPELAQVRLGLLHIFIQHTSASLSINENADPDVPIDLDRVLAALAPDSFPTGTRARVPTTCPPTRSRRCWAVRSPCQSATAGFGWGRGRGSTCASTAIAPVAADWC